MIKLKDILEGTFGGNDIAIYDGDEGLTYIQKRGSGYYGYNNKFDFTASSKQELLNKLKMWNYRLVSGKV